MSSKSKSVEAEYTALVKASLESHGGYLCKPILSLASSLEVSPLHTAYFIGALVLTLHLVLPSFLLPHFSTLITLIPSVQATLNSIAREQSRREAKDAAQWCVYWVIFTFSELARGVVSIYAPSSTPFFEFGRTLCLVICGGPWFGKAGLVSGQNDFAQIERPESADKELQEKSKRSERAADI